VRLRTHIETEHQRHSIEIRDEDWYLLQGYVRVVKLIASPPVDPIQFIPRGNKTIFIRTLARRTLKIDGVSVHSHTVEQIKQAIWDKYRSPPDQQRLIFDGDQLEDEHTLGHYNVYPGATISLVLRLRGAWGLPLNLKKRRRTVPPLPRAQPLDPSQFIQRGFICLHYLQRTVLTSWNADFKVRRFVLYSFPNPG